MPERQNRRRVPSPKVQGEDSWIEVTRLTVGEAREVQTKRGDPDVDAFVEVGKIYARHIVGWNWVDDDGDSLPLPKNDISVIDSLTDLEFTFIAEILGGSEEERKNLPSGS